MDLSKTFEEQGHPLEPLVMCFGGDKKYDIIYADPPWRYYGNVVLAKSSLLGGKNDIVYNSMSIDELKKLPVQNISANKSLLFMWVASPKLDEGIELMIHWGFKYSTIGFIWYKQSTNPGYYTMSECEICIIGRRGGIPSPRGKRNVRQFLSEKSRAHSAKPFEIRKRIEEMFPTQKKIELFARDKSELFNGYGFEGWDVWGNEAPKHT